MEPGPESTTRRGRAARAAVLASAGVQILAIAALVTLGIASDGPIVDRLRPVPIAVVYALPGVLAVLAARGRGPLLLAAGLSALVLAVFPFSVHSFVLGPVGIIYLVGHGRLSDTTSDGTRSAVTALGCVALTLAAFVVLFLHDDPVCYTTRTSGEVTIDRDPDDISSQHIPADSNITESGCTSDTIVSWEAAASLTLSSSAIALGAALTPRTRYRRARVRTNAGPQGPNTSTQLIDRDQEEPR